MGDYRASILQSVSYHPWISPTQELCGLWW